MLNCILGLVAVMILAFSIYSCANLRPASTPLISLSLIIDIVIVGAIFGALRYGVYTAYFISIITFSISVYKNKNNIKQKISGFFTPGVTLFAISSILMLIFLSCKKPLIHQWDEYSFWGMSRKLLKEHDTLYTYFKSSILGKSYPPALPILTYFFQWFTPAFSEWMCFFAYDVMFFACFCAFTSVFEKKDWNSAFFTFLIGFITPYFFAVRFLQGFMEPMYISLYADTPLAMVFSGVIAIYFFSDKNNGIDIFQILPIIMFLSFIKDMGFALSCIAVFVIFVDMLVGKKEYTFFKLKGIIAKFCSTLSMLIVTFGSFFAWSFHMSRVLSTDRSDVGGSGEMSMVGIVVNGLKELLLGPQTEKFAYLERRFITALFDVKVSMIGRGIVVIFMITILFIVSFLLSDKIGKKRCLAMYITSFIGFVGYYIFHLLLYVYVFGNEAYSLASYERYIYTYYIGWMNMALFNLYYSSKNGKKKLSQSAIIGFGCCMLMTFSYYVKPENMFIGINDNMYGARKAISAKTEIIKDKLNSDDVVYFYCGDDSGERWFTYTFELSNTYIIPNQGLKFEGDKEKRQKELYDRFIDYGVTHVVIDTASKIFEDDFGELFDEPMYGIGGNEIACYKVDYKNDMMKFHLVKRGVAQID